MALTWLAVLRFGAPVLLALSLWFGWVWVQDLRAERTRAKERVSTLESQIRDTGNQLLRRMELETRLEQDRDQIASRLRAAESRSVRLPGLATTANTDPSAGSSNEAKACGLSTEDARNLEITLGRIYRDSSRLAAEADTCAAQLTALQTWAHGLQKH
jgi:hypothetical protein